MLKWIFNKSTFQFVKGVFMKGKVVERCFDEIQNIVSEMDYVLVDVEYKKQHSGMVLEIIIDKEGGVNINDCEAVSRALDKPLDDIDPTNGAPYSLNVSSMGLDRPIVTDYQFGKYCEKEIEVKFYETQKPYNKKNLVGVLKAWDDESITLSIEDNTNINLPRKIIAQIVPVIKV